MSGKELSLEICAWCLAGLAGTLIVAGILRLFVGA